MVEIRHDSMETTSDTQEGYNEIYREGGLLQRDSFYLWLLHLLNPQPGRLLLDISCGIGKLVSFAQRQGMRAIGVDFAWEAIRSGKGECPEAGWAVSDGELLPVATASVDYVTHIGSLEHYQNPAKGLREIARVLKPTGKVCILLPNTYGLFGNIKHVLQTGDVFDDGQPLQRYNTRQGWHNMMVDSRLRPYKTLKYEREWPYTIPDFLWYLRSPKKLMRLFVSWFIPVNLSNCLVYLCDREDET